MFKDLKKALLILKFNNLIYNYLWRAKIESIWNIDRISFLQSEVLISKYYYRDFVDEN